MSEDLVSGGKRSGSRKGIFLLIVLAILGALAFFVLSAKDEAEADERFTFECNAERVEFLNKQGLIVEPEPEKEKITLPAEFNAAYNEYNELQKSQGLDLSPYAGKEAVKYTYRVLNYPDYPENIFVNIIMDGNRMIAADITCTDGENGFTKALISETMQTALSM